MGFFGWTGSLHYEFTMKDGRETGRRGRANWRWTASELMERHFRGDICFSAEYTDHALVDSLIAEDIRFARSLFAPRHSC